MLLSLSYNENVLVIFCKLNVCRSSSLCILLEILDEITRQSYENTLPKHINGNLRNALVRQYQLHKGTEYIPSNVPIQLKWTLANPMNLLPVITDSPWQMVDGNKSRVDKQQLKQDSNTIPKKNYNTYAYVAAKGTIPLDNSSGPRGAKRKINSKITETVSKSKKPRTSFNENQDSPVGLIWDSKNWSCAYDAIFTILCDIWIQNPKKWSKLFNEISMPLQMLAFNYKEVIKGKKTLEKARNKVRNVLYNENKEMFPKGASGTSISDLAKKLVNGAQPICCAILQCSICNTETTLDPPENLMYIHSRSKNINDWFQAWQKDTAVCNRCHTLQIVTHKFVNIPEVLMFSIDTNNIAISKSVKISTSNKTSVLPLKGVVYLGDYHFTSRLISDKSVWFHDGRTTKSKCKKEGHISDFDDKKFRQCNNAQAVLAIYSKK